MFSGGRTRSQSRGARRGQSDHGHQPGRAHRTGYQPLLATEQNRRVLSDPHLVESSSATSHAGLLRRTSSPTDARAAQLAITPAGKAVVAQHRLEFEERARDALQSLSVSLAEP